MRKLFKGSSEKERKNLNLWPSPSFFFLSFDVMIGPLLFDQGLALDNTGYSKVRRISVGESVILKGRRTLIYTFWYRRPATEEPVLLGWLNFGRQSDRSMLAEWSKAPNLHARHGECGFECHRSRFFLLLYISTQVLTARGVRRSLDLVGT